MRKKIKQLHISYFRDMVNSCPDIRPGSRRTGGAVVSVVALFENNKRVEVHQTNTDRGKELVLINKKCEEYKRILITLEAEWVGLYGEPCEKMKIRHFGNTQNRMLFDSLKERGNSYKFSENSVLYHGKQYRSKLEADFAKIMDEYGILYKYEPGVELFGNITKYPDFVIYLPWLDLLIMVEIFGRCEDPGYLEDNKDKFHDYLLSGWIPGYNMLSFFYDDRTPYIREMIMEEIETVELRKCMILCQPKGNG